MGDKLEGQRRQVTVLFADMVDYTTISERLGEEATYGLMQAVLEPITRAVHEQGGKVQTYTGDGVMALFGAPTGLEDAPLSACKVALEIQEKIALIGDEIESIHGARPIMRVGINSGPVVIGKVGTDTDVEFTPLGDTVNVAARLETEAEHGKILISEATWELVDGRVEASFAGERQLKGKAQAQRVFRLDNLKAGTTRFDVAVDRGLTQLVGRETELDVLDGYWREAEEGRVRVVSVVGEAGIGKSRLVHEFRERVGQTDVSFLRGYCAAEGRMTPFLPIIEVIRRAYRIGYDRSPQVIEQKLRGGLEIAGLPVNRHLPYLANLLGINVGTSLENIDPETVGIRTRETLQLILREQCRMSSVVMLIEDLHWIDSASMAYLQWMAEVEEPLPLLVLCTYRPEFQPPWRDRANVTELALSALSRAGAEELLKHRLSIDRLPESVAEHLVDRAEGNPLFLEELANYLTESDRMQAADGGVSQRDEAASASLPNNLENLLMQRVDRLDAGPREVLKVASVIGGLFTQALVGSIIVAHAAVGPSLDELVRQDVLVAVTASDDTRYRIKHALIGDALHNSLLSGEREALHLATAKAIEHAYAGHESEAAETLVHQYSYTSRVEKRVHYLYLAGQKSLRVFAIQEAHQRFRQALDLLETNPGAADQVFTVDLILANSRAYYLLGDYAQMIPLMERYLPVVEELGDKGRLSHCLSELGHAHMDTARTATAKTLLDRALTLGHEINDEGAVGHASMVLAAYHVFWQPPSTNRRETVNRLAEQAFEIGKRIGDNWLTAEALFEHAAHASTNGNPREGRKQAQRLLELGRADDNPYARQLGVFTLAILDAYNNAPEEAIQKSDETLRIGLSPLFRSYANAVKGAALVLAGQPEEAFDLFQRIRQEAVDKDQFFVFMLADYSYGVAHVLKGDIAKGVRWIEESIQRFEKLECTPYFIILGHLTLGEVFFTMAYGGDKPPFAVVLKNLGFLLRTMPFATSKSRRHLEIVEQSSRKYEIPSLLAWALMDLGLLAQAKKRTAEARTYLEEAYEIADSVDAFAIAEKSKAVLKDLD